MATVEIHHVTEEASSTVQFRAELNEVVISEPANKPGSGSPRQSAPPRLGFDDKAMLIDQGESFARL